MVIKKNDESTRYLLTDKGRSLNRIMYELGVYGIQSEDYEDCGDDIKEYFREIFNI